MSNGWSSFHGGDEVVQGAAAVLNSPVHLTDQERLEVVGSERNLCLEESHVSKLAKGSVSRTSTDEWETYRG